MKPPKYTQGDRIGKLTVKRYHGYAMVHPQTGKVTGDFRHWYLMRCDCGNTEYLNQKRLQDRTCCMACSKINRSRSLMKDPPPVQICRPGVPDFARLRLVSDEMLARIEAAR